MNKLTSMILILAVLTTGFALAQSPSPSEEAWTESVTYRGDGIFIIDFIKDIPWRTQYLMTLTDASGSPMTYIALGGDAGEAVVRAEGEIEPDALYTFTLIDTDSVFYAVGQSTAGMTYANSCEYCLAFGHDERDCAERIAAGVYETVRCDLCGELGHEDDFCPTRLPGAYCDECGEYGHDDDVCVYDDDDDPYDRCDLCGAYGHDEDRCTGMLQPTPLPKSASGTATGAGLNAVSSTPTPQPRQEYCDDCREYGHDDDECPYEYCDYCGQRGHDDDRCPERTCKRCGEKGHSRDDCPTKKCDECGEYGHDDDNCPNERCDECGEYGHDDDHCPDERCDECGKYGHDDDSCPNERNRHDD
ncbi:MAG: hypothetical protein IJE08_14210 [Clostridia bacterium]|nr:hypothetical protein [Clostridia bacterium]